MGEKIRKLVQQQWAGLIALFLVLVGGTAYAANTIGSADVIDNSLISADIRNDTATSPTGGLVAADLRAGSVGTSEVGTNALTGADIDETSLNSSIFTLGRSAFSNTDCDPDSSGDLVDCVGIQDLSLPRAGRVLLIAAGGQFSDSAGADGDCHLEVDDSTAAIPAHPVVQPGETADNTDSLATNGFAITAVTALLPAGAHDFELSCTENVADTRIDDMTISAVMIGAG